MENNKITVENLRTKLERGENVLLLDVRDPEKFENGSLIHPKASTENIPYVAMIDEDGNEKIQQRLDSIPADTEIVTVCTTGNKASKAAAYLREQGFSAVSLEGGLTAWRENTRQ